MDLNGARGLADPKLKGAALQGVGDKDSVIKTKEDELSREDRQVQECCDPTRVASHFNWDRSPCRFLERGMLLLSCLAHQWHLELWNLHEGSIHISRLAESMLFAASTQSASELEILQSHSDSAVSWQLAGHSLEWSSAGSAGSLCSREIC